MKFYVCFKNMKAYLLPYIIMQIFIFPLTLTPCIFEAKQFQTYKIFVLN